MRRPTILGKYFYLATSSDTYAKEKQKDNLTHYYFLWWIESTDRTWRWEYRLIYGEVEE